MSSRTLTKNSMATVGQRNHMVLSKATLCCTDTFFDTGRKPCRVLSMHHEHTRERQSERGREKCMQMPVHNRMCNSPRWAGLNLSVQKRHESRLLVV